MGATFVRRPGGQAAQTRRAVTPGRARQPSKTEHSYEEAFKGDAPGR